MKNISILLLTLLLAGCSEMAKQEQTRRDENAARSRSFFKTIEGKKVTALGQDGDRDLYIELEDGQQLHVIITGKYGSGHFEMRSYDSSEL